MHRSHGRVFPVVLALAATAILVAGCGPGPGGGGGTAVAAPATPVAARCRTAQLALSSIDRQGTAGSDYERLVLTNIGHSPCVVRGFPGVSFVDAAGRQVGAAAEHTGPVGAPVRLVPGGAATAVLRILHLGVAEGCTPPSGTAPVAVLRVYPPGNTEALRLTGPDTRACRDPAVRQLTVAAFTA
ncbi:DUF4232 domain-containing protein [Frankia sp. CcWB2]